MSRPPTPRFKAYRAPQSESGKQLVFGSFFEKSIRRKATDYERVSWQREATEFKRPSQGLQVAAFDGVLSPKTTFYEPRTLEDSKF